MWPGYCKITRARHKKALGLQLNEPGSADLLELERMRILVVSAMFPPNVLGGAEISAFNLSSWLLKQGHEIGVLTAAKSREEEKFGELGGQVVGDLAGGHCGGV